MKNSLKFSKFVWIGLIIVIYALFQQFGIHQSLTTIKPAGTLLPERLAEMETADGPIIPIPTEIKLDANTVRLGERLFHDRILSSDKSVSCADCHDLAAGGVDWRMKSIGAHGKLGPINAPTVFNVNFNFRLMWNGKFETLEDQLDKLIANPVVFDMDWPRIVNRLKSSPEYTSAFNAIYADGISKETITNAMVTLYILSGPRFALKPNFFLLNRFLQEI